MTEPTFKIDARFFSQILMMPDGSTREIVPLERAERWWNHAAELRAEVDQLRSALSNAQTAAERWYMAASPYATPEALEEALAAANPQQSIPAGAVPRKWVTRAQLEALYPKLADPFDCQEFHELCMDYRGARAGLAQHAYERLQAYSRGVLNQWASI